MRGGEIFIFEMIEPGYRDSPVLQGQTKPAGHPHIPQSRFFMFRAFLVQILPEGRMLEMPGTH